MDVSEKISPQKVSGTGCPEVTQPSSEEFFKIQQGRAQIAFIHLAEPQTIPGLSKGLEWRCPELSPLQGAHFKMCEHKYKVSGVSLRTIHADWWLNS